MPVSYLVLGEKKGSTVGHKAKGMKQEVVKKFGFSKVTHHLSYVGLCYIYVLSFVFFFFLGTLSHSLWWPGISHIFMSEIMRLPTC